MSDIATPTVPGARTGLPWGLWWSQLRAIIRLELRKGFRRSFWLLILAGLAPFVASLYMLHGVRDASDVAQATQVFAVLYQFILRIVIFFGCVAIFANLIRRETLERSLHYYFLSPVRRDLLVLGKYLTALIVSFTLFAATTVLSFVLTYLAHDSTAVWNFLLHGAKSGAQTGLGQLGSYLLVTFLACLGYGAVFLFFGFFFKSPAMPALAVFVWEGIYFLLPPLLKQLSVIHYLQPLCPVPISQGTVAMLTEAPPPWVSVLGLTTLALVLVAISGWKIRRMEITYEEA